MILGEILPYPELILPIIFVAVAIIPWTLVKVQSTLMRAMACLALGFGTFFLMGEVFILFTSEISYPDYINSYTQDPHGLLTGLSIEAQYVIEPLISYLSIGVFFFACATTAGIGRFIGVGPAAAFGAMGFAAVLPIWKSYMGAGILPGGAGLGGIEIIVVGLLLSAAPLCWAGLSAVRAFHGKGGRGMAMRLLGVTAGLLLTYVIYAVLVSMQYYYVGSDIVVMPDMIPIITTMVKALAFSRLWFFAMVGFTMVLAFWIMSDLIRSDEDELQPIIRGDVTKTPKQGRERRSTRKIGAQVIGQDSPRGKRVLGPPVQVQKPTSKRPMERKATEAMPKTPVEPESGPFLATPSTPPTRKITRREPPPAIAPSPPGTPPATPSLPTQEIQQQAPARATPPPTPTLPVAGAQPVPDAGPQVSPIDPYSKLIQEMSVFFKYINRVERRLAAPTIVRFRNELTELINNYPTSEGRPPAEQLLMDIEAQYMSGYE